MVVEDTSTPASQQRWVVGLHPVGKSVILRPGRRDERSADLHDRLGNSLIYVEHYQLIDRKERELRLDNSRIVGTPWTSYVPCLWTSSSSSFRLDSVDPS